MSLIAVGVVLHIVAGLLFWLFPPGTSIASWTAYLGMGVVGFVHIFIGGEMLRQDAPAPVIQAEPVFTAAMLEHLTGEPQSLSPRELHINGGVLVAAVLAVGLVTCVVLWMTIAAQPSPLGP